MYPYEVESFVQCWWETLAPRFDIPFKNHELLILRKPACKGFLKLREVRVAGWNSAWAQYLTPERVKELQEVDVTTAWDYFRINLNDTHENQAGLDALKQSGFPFLLRPNQTQHLIDMSAGYEGYLKSLSHNSRKNLTKKTRRAAERNPHLAFCSSDAEIDAFFEEFFSYHIPYWTEKTGSCYFTDPHERAFIVAWAKILSRSGQLLMDRLMMNDEAVNLSMGIRDGDTFYWLLTINSGKQLDAAPGIVGLNLRLQDTAAQGVRNFNMGAGDYFYKLQCANSQMTCQELTVFNPRSPIGQVMYHALKRKAAKAEATSEASEAEG